MRDRLLSLSHWELEASQTFLYRSLLEILLHESFEEDDPIDLWLDILGFPDSYLFFNKEIIICHLFNSSEYVLARPDLRVRRAPRTPRPGLGLLRGRPTRPGSAERSGLPWPRGAEGKGPGLASSGR